MAENEENGRSGQSGRGGQSPEIKALVAKLNRVVAGTSAVMKRGFNENKRYFYATDADVLVAVREALAANGVFLFTIPGMAEHVTLPPAEGKVPMDQARLVVTFILHDEESGQWKGIDWPGEARDTTDKAEAKAITSAQKTFLLKQFLLPTFEDADSDGRAPRQQRAEPALSGRKVSKDEALFVKKLLGETHSDVNAFLEYYAIGNVESLPVEHYGEVVAKLQERKGQA